MTEPMTEPDAAAMLCIGIHGYCQGRSCMSWRWVDDPEIVKVGPRGECGSPLVNPEAFTRAMKIAIYEAKLSLEVKG